MKRLTQKQILAVNEEIKKTAIKMRHNRNNPHEVIGYYTAKIEMLTNLISNGYKEYIGFEDTLEMIASLELTFNQSISEMDYDCSLRIEDFSNHNFSLKK